jgi:hypothetical protein
MKFPKPLTVRLRTGQTIVQSDFNLVLTDDSRNKRVVAQLLPVSKPFTLWSGDAYDAAGDYTQSQAEARLLEILGPNPAAMLTTPDPKPLVFPVPPPA